jgi:His-Xaa-Ser system radical SAM maturase HxsB
MEAIKRSRKFKSFEFYDNGFDAYFLLPFRFHRINDEMEVIVNEVGDFLILKTGDTHKIINREISKLTHGDLYADLLSNFFISEERIPPLLNILATRYRTKKSFLNNFTALHIFVISLRCEHTCHYCQVSRATEDKSSFDMSIDHINKGINMMMKSPNKNVTMEFQGGEALLAFDNIIYAVKRTKELALQYNKNVGFVICTNLALVSEAILHFCKENNILISTSLDGPDYVHNKNRHRPEKNSYELTINGIDLCKSILGIERISALMTTTNLSLDFPNEIVDEYYRLGFNNIFLRPISPYGFARHNAKKNKYETEQYLAFYKVALNHIIDYNLSGVYLREDYATIILKKMLTPFPVGYVDLQSPAGLINNVIVFNYDGKIYATDESRMLAEMKDFTFQLGDLDNSSYNEIFYGEKSQEISKVFSNESLAGCSECAFQSYCGADPVHHHATQNDMYGYRPTSSFCQRNMEIIRHLFELMANDKKTEKVFRSWVSY